MTIDGASIVKAIVANSQCTKHPLELAVLDGCLCLRSSKDRSWTLTAGVKGQNENDSLKRIWQKLSRTRNQRIVVMLGGEAGKRINLSKLLLPLAIKGLY